MDVLERDFFTDPELFQDPTPWYAAVRERGPVWREPHRGVFVLSGIDEILEVYSDLVNFSAVVSSLGPMVPLPERVEGESWADMIERYLTERRDLDGVIHLIDGEIADDINRSVIQEQVEMGVAVRMAAMDLLARNLRAKATNEVTV